MFKSSIFIGAALYTSTTSAQYDTAATCRSCIDSGGTQCLTSSGGVTFYDTATCCPKGSKTVFCSKPYGQQSFNYCADKTKIKNKYIQNWTCP